jgi:hypothetical protein
MATQEIDQTVIDRMLQKVVPGATEDECWGWEGGVSHTNMGCPQFFLRLNGQPVGFQACRVSWAAANDSSPHGHFIHHACGNNSCTNPRHLIARAHEIAPADREIIVRREACRNGHKLAGGNLYVSPKGHRACRRCADNRRAAYNARRNGVTAA